MVICPLTDLGTDAPDGSSLRISRTVRYHSVGAARQGRPSPGPHRGLFPRGQPKENPLLLPRVLPSGAESRGHGLHHGAVRPGVQGYVAAVEGAVQAPDGREHHPWRQSRSQMDGRQRGDAAGSGREHQSGQRKIRRKDRRNRGVHHGTGPLHPQRDWQWQCL